MKILKSLIQFFKNLFTKKQTVETTGAKTKRSGRRSAPRERTNAEKIFDFLQASGYTKYVHPRGEYAVERKRDPEPSSFRAWILRYNKLRTETEEAGKKVLFSPRRNKYGGRDIIESFK